jgi:chromosomal replication initiator protein
MQTPPAFSRFVTLSENRSALTATRELADRLGTNAAERIPNPLFLHGPPGVGKSLLVGALAEEVCRRCPALTACVLSANDFPLPWAAADEAEAASERYQEARRCDLLIIEDLQHLPERAAEALVQLLDERLRRRLATVLTALAGPGQLAHRGNTLPARLTNRLAGGLVVALEPLGAPSRLVFLQELARRRGMVLSDEVLNWLAESLAGGGRQLEGALRQIDALQKVRREPLTLDQLREQFRSPVEASQPTVERIVRRVSDHFRVEPRQLQSARRHRELLLARQVSMYLARQLTRLSLEQIGKYFGGRDHTTVLHACRKVEEAMRSDALLSGTVRRIHAELA